MAVRSLGISGHDSDWPGRIVSGDSGSAGGEGLNPSSCLPCSSIVVDLYVLMMFCCIDRELCVYGSLISIFLMRPGYELIRRILGGRGPIGWTNSAGVVA